MAQEKEARSSGRWRKLEGRERERVIDALVDVSRLLAVFAEERAAKGAQRSTKS
jgi:hypothetical protein